MGPPPAASLVVGWGPCEFVPFSVTVPSAWIPSSCLASPDSSLPLPDFFSPHPQSSRGCCGTDTCVLLEIEAWQESWRGHLWGIGFLFASFLAACEVPGGHNGKLDKHLHAAGALTWG